MMKIEEQVLRIEQMKHLQELGVDTSDASMYWVRAKRIIGKQRNNCLDNDMDKWGLSLSKSIVHSVDWAVESVPTYTIGDLIEKLPKSIDLGFGEYDLELSIKGEYVEVQYENDYDDCTPFFCSNLSLIESLYRILCWLAENHKELL